VSTLGVDVDTVQDVVLTGGTRLTRPGAALAALRRKDSSFLVVSATLIGNAAERLAQAGELQSAIERLVPGDPPTIISAEGSDRPGTAAWQSLVENRVGVAGRLFVDGRVSVRDAAALPGKAPGSGVRLTLEL
jgi:hypothetical protein